MVENATYDTQRTTYQRRELLFRRFPGKSSSLVTLCPLIILLVQCLQIQSLDFDLAVCRCEKSSHYDKPFVVLWNSPTGGCHVNFSVDIELEKFGILTNTNQTWNGDVITVFYNANLGLYPYFDWHNSTISHNGGMPQLINISEHLLKSSQDIIAEIPDPDYSGIAVIDWEGWRPLWDANFGEKTIYQTKSIELVEKEFKKKQNRLKRDSSNGSVLRDDEITKEAKKRFESTARRMMEATIKLGRHLRPKALWGFYGYPGCLGNITTGFTCTPKNKRWNDELHWLYKSCTALFPSIYLMEEHDENYKFVEERLSEAFRTAIITAKKTNKNLLPVFPYLRPIYRYSALQFKMLSEDDLENAIGQTADYGCAGLVLWGNHCDELTSRNVCLKYNEYLNKKLGPYITSLTEELETCSQEKCLNNGRCIDQSIMERKQLFSKNREKDSCKLSNDTIFNTGSKELQKNVSGIPHDANQTSHQKSEEKLSLKPSLNMMDIFFGNVSNKQKISIPTKTRLNDLESINERKQRPSKIKEKQPSLLKSKPSSKSSSGIQHLQTLLYNSSLNTTVQKHRSTLNVTGTRTVGSKNNNLPVISKHINYGAAGNRSKHVQHHSHTRTKIHGDLTDGSDRNRTVEEANNVSSDTRGPHGREKTRKRGYSATSSDETAVHIPSVYIILITVTLGGALLMTVIYVAIYYAVNVRGRSHDHTYDNNFDEHDDNPFAIDDHSPWWNEHIDQKQRLLNKNNKK